MGLFDYFWKRNGHLNGNGTAINEKIDVPEDIFIAKDKNEGDENKNLNGTETKDVGINLLFQFLEKNYEAKGYDDALINPDTMHLEHNVQALKNDLERTIRKVKTFYEDFIRQINFHISSRSRSGMIDTVEELTVKKQTAEEHIKQVIEIEQQAHNNKGVGQGIIISYARGFKNGLAAISHHAILRQNF